MTSQQSLNGNDCGLDSRVLFAVRGVQCRRGQTLNGANLDQPAEVFESGNAGRVALVLEKVWAGLHWQDRSVQKRQQTTLLSLAAKIKYD